MVLTTSGREVARRQGLTSPTALDAVATTALLEMRELAHLPANTMIIDATPDASTVANRIDTVLQKAIFCVNQSIVAANLDGMSLSNLPLAEASGLLTPQATEDWALRHGIPPDTRPDRPTRILRVAAAEKQHPSMVCPDLSATDAAKY